MEVCCFIYVTRGGDGGTRLYAGGGSGGRIAVRYNSYTFSGIFQAFAGAGYTYGGRGTYYIESMRKLRENSHDLLGLVNGSKQLWVDNNGRSLFGKPASIYVPF